MLLGLRRHAVIDRIIKTIGGDLMGYHKVMLVILCNAVKLKQFNKEERDTFSHSYVH